MSEPSEDRFEAELRLRAEQVASAKGACPDGPTLMAHLLGGAGAGESEQIRLHIRRCGACDAVRFRFKRNRRVQSWKTAGIAACVSVVVLAGFAVVSDRLRPTYPTAPVYQAKVLSLDATRTISASTSGAQEALVMLFFIPIETTAPWQATIQDERGSVVFKSDRMESYDGKGDFLLIVSRSTMKPGRYRLTMMQSPSVRYEFPFEM